MNRARNLFCILLAVGSCGMGDPVPLPESAAADPIPVHVDVDLPDADRSEALRGLVTTTMDEHGFPGLSLAILQEGRLAYAAGFGTKSPGRDAAVGAGIRYRIASITKAVTAVAVFQLEEAGKLEIERPARAYCPEYPSKPVDPTVRHLLAHQSGIRHTTDREDTTIVGEFEPLAGVVPRFGDEELAFRPGADFLYTSWGYTLLGCVIENVSGMVYMDYLRERILKPSGMTSTVQDRPDFAAADFSSGFRRRGPRPIPSEVVDTRFKVPASGLISSATDLVRLIRALYEGKLLRRETLERMLQQQSTADGETGPFTLGWLAASGKDLGDAFYSSGSMEGTTALVYLIPERDYAVAILANLERSVQHVADLIDPINRLLLAE